jgi:hypothetical protein
MTHYNASRRGTRIVLILMVVGVLLAAVTAVLAAPARSSRPTGDSRKAEALRDVERTRLRALVNADMTVASRLHAANFQLVNPAGFLLMRDEYLAAVAAGDIDYLVFEPISEINVRLYGKAAVLTYQSKIDIVVAGLGRLTHEAWHTYLYEKHHGRWQAVWEQATAIGGFPPPSG